MVTVKWLRGRATALMKITLILPLLSHISCSIFGLWRLLAPKKAVAAHSQPRAEAVMGQFWSFLFSLVIGNERSWPWVSMKNLVLLVSLPVFTPPTPSEISVLLSHNPTNPSHSREVIIEVIPVWEAHKCVKGWAPDTSVLLLPILNKLLSCSQHKSGHFVALCALTAAQVQEHSSMPLVWKARWKLTFTFLTLFLAFFLHLRSNWNAPPPFGRLLLYSGCTPQVSLSLLHFYKHTETSVLRFFSSSLCLDLPDNVVSASTTQAAVLKHLLHCFFSSKTTPHFRIFGWRNLAREERHRVSCL